MKYFLVPFVFGILCQNTLASGLCSPVLNKPKSDKSEDLKFVEVSGKAYHIINSEKKDWSHAEKRCRDMQAHLVSLQNEEQWCALRSILRQDSYWTDITYIPLDNEFKSSTSYGAAPFLMWDEGEPNSTTDNEECVELKAKSDYKMNDAPCNDRKNFICEINYY